ncbi:hypothetical protein K402DRAFT_101286 [Aulographum hederae CBS 113979]|uniref:Uncharacterized protein n=1 Tax=Aulographum hederae CBS 113979 TaxID=1176131 RepID=A0A6G1GYE9_9PEZI|nr:hypothetical protein K402DRAFT_101286 [Aulographum hederae CBS 113979]
MSSSSHAPPHETSQKCRNLFLCKQPAEPSVTTNPRLSISLHHPEVNTTGHGAKATYDHQHPQPPFSSPLITPSFCCFKKRIHVIHHLSPSFRSSTKQYASTQCYRPSQIRNIATTRKGETKESTREICEDRDILKHRCTRQPFCYISCDITSPTT